MHPLAQELHAATVLLDAVRLLVQLDTVCLRMQVHGLPHADPLVAEGGRLTESVLSALTSHLERSRQVLALLRAEHPQPPAALLLADNAIARLESGRAELVQADQALRSSKRYQQHSARLVFDDLMGRLRAC